MIVRLNHPQPGQGWGQNQGQSQPQPETQTYDVRVPFLQQAAGLGDVVARMTQAMGVTPCQPCKQRQEALNQRVRLMPW